ncbi:MAG: hypothetical protein AB8B97_13590 [Granulosicoccus sp.]
MKRADQRQQTVSEINSDVLSSMIAELVRHQEEQLTGSEQNPDWQSPSRRTQIIKYGSGACLFNILNQSPDVVEAEYQLTFDARPVFCWLDFRWPHLQAARKTTSFRKIKLPKTCVDELMQYHIQANTSWLGRYRNSLHSDRTAQVNEVGVVTELDGISAL